jgi:cell division protein FtsL
MDTDKALEVASKEVDGFASAVAIAHKLIGKLKSQKTAIQNEIKALEKKKQDMAEMERDHANKVVQIKKAQRILDGIEAKIADMKTKKK